MALTDVNLFRIDGTVGSVSSAAINVIKNSASVSNNVVLNSDGTTTLTPSNIIKSGTAVASTSGTSIDFTGIPSWVKRVTVMFDGVSTNGTSIVQLQLGDAGGVETSGYAGVTVRTGGSNTYTSAYSSGFLTQTAMVAASTYAAQIVLTNITGNAWAMSGTTVDTTTVLNNSCFMCGTKTLSATLDRIRITTVNGTDAFDAGSINILYEG